jgi:regulator of RNase E activity RraA
MAEVSEATLEALRALDTPTVCNALELVAPERRALGFTVDPLVCARSDLPPIVGFARTATIRAAQPGGAAGAEMRKKRLGYYEYVAKGPAPSIVVIQDLDGPRRGFGAFWGEVNTAIHKGLGCLGCVTDGSIRDLDQVAPGFQLLADRVGPSHAHVHLVDFGGQVVVAGMQVRDGDLIHADRHGAVTIPFAVADKVAGAAALLQKREAVILGAARKPGFNIDILARAMADADEIH